MQKTMFKLALVAIIITTLFACGKSDEGKPTSVDFTIDVSTGALATIGGTLVNSGALIVRTDTADFIAVTSVCTNEGTHVPLNYDAVNNKFVCPTHNEQYSSLGIILFGSGTKNLTKYNTILTGTMLRVYSE